MVSLQPPVCDFGSKAVDFSLKGTDGATYTLDGVRGPKGTLVMFICNHCPYVKAILGRLVRFLGSANGGRGGVSVENSNREAATNPLLDIGNRFFVIQ